MTKEQYLILKKDLNSVHRRQYDKKKQLKAVERKISQTQQRLDRNKVLSPEGHSGAEYVPRDAVDLLYSLYRSVSAIQKDLNKNVIKIQELEQSIIKAKVARAFMLAMDKYVSQVERPTPRGMVQSILKVRGLFLHDNNEISGTGGKLVAMYRDDAKMVDGKLTYSIKPIQAVDFIMMDIKL